MYPSLISFSNTDRNTDTYQCIATAWDALHHSYNLSILRPTKWKATLILSSYAD